MDYSLVCLAPEEQSLSPEATAQSVISQAHLHGRWRVEPHRNIVLFAYAVSHPQEVSEEQARGIIFELMDQAIAATDGDLYISGRHIDIKSGSLDITILLDGIAAALPSQDMVRTYVFSGGALWAADKIAGGPLSTFGQNLTASFISWLSQLWRRRESNPVVQIPEPTIEVADIERMAQMRAEQVGQERKCNTAIRRGGQLVGNDVYYTYDLVNCADTYTQKKRVTIIIDRLGKNPPKISVD